MDSKRASTNTSQVCCTLGILPLFVASLAFAGGAGGSTVVAGYRFTSFDVPDAGPIGTVPHHINNAGVITGGYIDSNFIEHGFVRAKDGSVISFDAPLAVGTTDPEGINDAGDIVGRYFDVNGFAHGFLRDNKGKFTSIDVPFAGTGDTLAFAINNVGTITGWYLDPNFNAQVFLRSKDGEFTAVNVPGAAMGALSMSINEQGVIDGVSQDSNSVFHGFLRHIDGSITTFDAPDAGTGSGQGTLPAIFLVGDTDNGLNDRGDLTGAAVDSSLTAHGFLRTHDGNFVSFDVPGGGVGNYNGTWPGSINSSDAICGTYGDENDGLNQGFVRNSDGSIVPFAAPGAVQTSPFDINDSGEIAGLWIDASGTAHGFIMEPHGK